MLVFSQEKTNSTPKEKQIEGVVITKTKKPLNKKADRTILIFLNNLSSITETFWKELKTSGACIYRHRRDDVSGKNAEVYLNGRPLNITSNELNSFPKACLPIL